MATAALMALDATRIILQPNHGMRQQQKGDEGEKEEKGERENERMRQRRQGRQGRQAERRIEKTAKPPPGTRKHSNTQRSKHSNKQPNIPLCTMFKEVIDDGDVEEIGLIGW